MIHGITRDPASSSDRHQHASFSKRNQQHDQHGRGRLRAAAVAAVPGVAIAGISTSTMTVNMSSTISQPTATCPAVVSSARLSVSTRISTTVLATAIAMPSTMPGLHRPAERDRDARAQQRRDAGSARSRRARATLSHGQQILEMKVQPDAEHQQDHAELGQLRARGARRRRNPGVCGPIATPASR